MPDELKTVLDALGKLYGLPGYALAFIGCLVSGYIVRAIKKIPNDSIPAIVTILGGLFNISLADPYSPPTSLRLWVWKNVIIGLVIGHVAIRFHRGILKPLETRYPWLGVGSGNSDQYRKGQPGWEPQKLDGHNVKGHWVPDEPAKDRIQNPPHLQCEPGGGSVAGSPITPQGK